MLYSLLNTLHTDKTVYTYVGSYILIMSKDADYIITVYILNCLHTYVLHVCGQICENPIAIYHTYSILAIHNLAKRFIDNQLTS